MNDLVKQALLEARERISYEDYQGTCSCPCRRTCACIEEHNSILDRIDAAIAQYEATSIDVIQDAINDEINDPRNGGKDRYSVGMRDGLRMAGALIRIKTGVYV